MWEIARSWDWEVTQKLLNYGWEPFAVTVSMGNQEVTHFRRFISKESK